MNATAQASLVGRRQRRSGGGMQWPDARTRAGTAALPLAARPLPLKAAGGCLLVADLLALTDLPVTDISAIDGWAVAGDPPWKVVADLFAGQLLEHRLGDGQCVGIATGAVIPEGADTVLPAEHSLRDGAGVRALAPTRLR